LSVFVFLAYIPISDIHFSELVCPNCWWKNITELYIIKWVLFPSVWSAFLSYFFFRPRGSMFPLIFISLLVNELHQLIRLSVPFSSILFPKCSILCLRVRLVNAAYFLRLKVTVSLVRGIFSLGAWRHTACGALVICAFFFKFIWWL
jgi:hypothetical protein